MEIIEIYKSLDESYIQGSGGNFSYKEDNLIYIKSSGLTQEQVTVNNLSICDINIIRDGYEKNIAWQNVHKSAQVNTRKPSMEIGFHALSKYKYMLHFHNIFLNLMVIEGKITKNVIDYACPGIELTNKLKTHLDKPILHLKNHGQIIQSNTIEGLQRCIDELNFIIQTYTKEKFSIPPLVQNNGHWTHDGPYKYLTGSFLFPDAVVFGSALGSNIINKGDHIQLYMDKNAAVKAAVNLYTHAYMERFLSLRNVNPDYIKETNRIIEHPDEQYRRKLCN